EVTFGLPLNEHSDSHSKADPAVLEIDGREVKLSGQIDRLQWSQSGSGVVVIDYKTGTQRDKKTRVFDGGRALQLPLYLTGPGHLLGRSPEEGTAEYFYVSRRADFARHSMTGEKLEAH